jgi:integrase
MAVYDRWHRQPREGEKPCKCSRGRTPLYPSAAHLQGDRWQVRYRDDNGKQCSRNFPLREGRDPGRHAEAFDAMIRRQLDTGDYADPSAALVTFREYAEQWRASRTRDDPAKMERSFRLHVYPVLGHLSLRKLSRQPSLIQGWITGLEQKLAPVTARQLVTDVSGMFAAAMGDGLISANPVRSSTVKRPPVPPKKARAWPAGRVQAMAAALPERFAVVPLLGADAGLRQGELFGLAVEDVDFLRRTVRVVRQVKQAGAGGVLCFAPPKRGKTRTVPLAPELAEALAEHIRAFPPASVTLPWHEPRSRRQHGQLVTARLIVTASRGGALRRQQFNRYVWHPAQLAAGVERTRDEGMHALRHTFASLQLQAGNDPVSVADWMGDTPAVVLATYAHFLPGREDSGRSAVSAYFGGASARNVPSGRRDHALWLADALRAQITRIRAEVLAVGSRLV